MKLEAARQVLQAPNAADSETFYLALSVILAPKDTKAPAKAQSLAKAWAARSIFPGREKFAPARDVFGHQPVNLIASF